MKRILPVVFLLLALTSCSSQPAGPQTLTVMTHDSFAATDTLIKSFEQANNARLTFIKGGDAGAVLNKAILSKPAPLADVLYGVDNTFLSRALGADIYESYDSPALKKIPAEFQLDPTQRALPVDYGDVCINYDKGYFSAHQLPVPTSLEELTRPEYKGLLVTENPATSSPGLAFLLATIKHFGEPDYLGYWKDLRQNGLQVVDGWETAYYPISAVPRERVHNRWSSHTAPAPPQKSWMRRRPCPMPLPPRSWGRIRAFVKLSLSAS